MGALRQARSFNMDGQNNQGTGSYTPSMNQSLPTLIVMIVILFIIMAFCFWGAPAVRAFCRRRVCCCCPMDEPNTESEFSENESTTPTVILLPYGRMLVVDRSAFAQLRATHTGIDFMELSTNLIRAQRRRGSTAQTPSISRHSDKMFSSNPEFLPPAYEEIYGRSSCDFPPSYSEISLVKNKRELKLENCRTLNAGLRTYPSVPSMSLNKRHFLLNLHRKFVSLEAINTSLVRNCTTNEANTNPAISNRPTSSQNVYESRV